MSNNEQTPNTNSSSPVEEQTPHSGRHGYEQPHREYDNTPLGAAPLDYDPRTEAELTTEHLPGDLRVVPSTPEKTKLGWKKLVAGLALVAATAAGVFGGVKALGGDSDKDPANNKGSDKTATASPNAGETRAQETETSDFAPVALTVENYQDGDQLIRAWNSEHNKWVMSGSDLEDTVDWGDPEGSIIEIAEGYDAEYKEMLLVDDWQERPQLRDVVDSYTDQHRVALNASIMTGASELPQDIEPYKQRQDVTMTRVEESTPDKMVISYRYVQWSNADKNRGDLYIENVNGKEGGSTITFLNQDGVWKISDIKHFAG